MGKKTQFLSKIIFLLCIVNIANAQCTDSIYTETKAGCTRYNLSEKTFVELFVASKNPDTIGMDADNLQRSMDSTDRENKKLVAINKKIGENYKKEITQYQLNDSTKTSLLNECSRVSGDLNKDNIDLRIDNKRLKKKQVRLVGLGAALTLLVEIGIKVLIIK